MFVFVLTHVEPHAVKPAAHATAHLPAVHVALPLAGAPHTLVHDPQ